MQEGLLLVDEDREGCIQMAELVLKAGYSATITCSVDSALEMLRERRSDVVLLCARFDDMTLDVITLYKECYKKLPVILVPPGTSLDMLRKMRNKGVNYHALTPLDSGDRCEKPLTRASSEPKTDKARTLKLHITPQKEKTMNAKQTLTAVCGTLALIFATTSGAHAAATNKVYVSGPLILLFLGFCALVVTVQCIPAIITIYGMIKEALSGSREKAEARSRIN